MTLLKHKNFSSGIDETQGQATVSQSHYIITHMVQGQEDLIYSVSTYIGDRNTPHNIKKTIDTR